jgi:hypothetical protein
MTASRPLWRSFYSVMGCHKIQYSKFSRFGREVNFLTKSIRTK